jgi:hypothetical protein
MHLVERERESLWMKREINVNDSGCVYVGVVELA